MKYDGVGNVTRVAVLLGACGECGVVEFWGRAVVEFMLADWLVQICALGL